MDQLEDTAAPSYRQSLTSPYRKSTLWMNTLGRLLLAKGLFR
jgi:hypothetical protein